MERFKHIKETLMTQVESQMANLHLVDTKELGEVIDMIKDLEEAIYYCTITEAMKEPKWEEKGHEKRYYPIEMPYYQEGGIRETPIELRDSKEGRSPKTRKMYMESKDMHHDKAVQMQELEQYMKELSKDIVEMIEGASPEEKQLLKSKLTTLVSKIDQV